MEATNVDVSVIIPVYNQTDQLAKCIKGFQKQKFSSDIKWEIIIADDGSDNRVEDDQLIRTLISQFDNSVNVISSTHCGRAKIRNIATNVARGRVLVFCDGDRIPCKEYVQRHYDVINKNEKAVSVGNPKDFWGKYSAFDEGMNTKSRNTNYFNCISSIFTEPLSESVLTTSSHLAWLSLLDWQFGDKKKRFGKGGGI